MITVPPIPFRRRRGHPRRVPPAALALVGVEVTYFDGFDGSVLLSFNTTAAAPLGDVSAADPTKWVARFDGMRYVGNALYYGAFDSLVLNLSATIPDAGPDEINYSNAPSDIGDALGRQLAALAGFPL